MSPSVVRLPKVGRRPNTTIERLVYRTLIIIFDTLDDTILRWACPFDKGQENRPVESDQWDDAEILRRYNQYWDDLELEGMSESPFGGGVGKIGDHTFVKVTGDLDERYLEASSSEFVRTRTTIPIPRIRRTLVNHDGSSVNVMDFIPGSRLDHAWPSLSLWTKLWVALTLRRYVRQLRQIKDSRSSVPGTLAISPQTLDGYMFYKQCGPFPDYASLSAFYNRKLDIAKGITLTDGRGNIIRSPRPDAEPFDDSKPLVFIHGDLSMRNIILGRDGKIWLVDWGMSGFFPWWFEYVSTVYAAENDVAPDSWNRLIPFIVDPLFKHMKWMDFIAVALVSYS